MGWDPQMATFTAGHVSDTGPGGTARFDHELGSTRAAYPSPGALEEGLGFALPSNTIASNAAQAAASVNTGLGDARQLFAVTRTQAVAMSSWRPDVLGSHGMGALRESRPW